jgi:hypothetical protein
MTAPALTLPSSDHIDCSRTLAIATNYPVALLRGELRRLAWAISNNLCAPIVMQRFAEDHSPLWPVVIAPACANLIEVARVGDAAGIDDCVDLILPKVAR